MRPLGILRSILAAALAMAVAVPALAQDTPQIADGGERQPRTREVRIDPYIEVSQAFAWQLSPRDDVVTYTQLAAGVDASIQGRNNGGTVSVRYERNLAWNGERGDNDTVVGIARGYASVVPRVLTVEAGALATRTRVDGSGGSVFDPLVEDGTSAQTYAVYAGPNLRAHAGDVDVTGNYRFGYTSIGSPSGLRFDGTIDEVFDASTTHSASIRAGTRPGETLPVGLAVGGGFFQEDFDDLDQRIRDAYVRGDVIVPVSSTVAFMAGVGVEDVEVSNRDALRDENGDPVVSDGHYVTDEGAPRRIAYEADGLIWDAGVVWRPSRRTELEAHVGHRYDSWTYYGHFNWRPDSRSQLSVGVYDGIQGLGGRLVGTLAGLPNDFVVIRDPVTGAITGCVGSSEGADCLDGLLGSLRSGAFRGRGVSATYSHRLGRATAGISAGYDNRRFIAAEDTVLGPANGITDESFYVASQLSGPIWRGSYTVTSYANWFRGGGGDKLFSLGSSAAYSQRIWQDLSARAALAVSLLDSDLSAETVRTATALVGLRYDF